MKDRTRVSRLAATALVVGGLLVLSACSGGQAEAAPEETEVTAEIGGTTPPENSVNEHDPEVTDGNAAELLSELELKEGMTPEEIGQQYTEIINRWGMAGATPDTFYRWLNDNDGTSAEEIAAQIAAKNAEVYATALFGENYEATANATILEFVQGGIVDNEAYLNYYMSTYSDESIPNSNTQNKEVWNWSIENLNNTVKSDKDGVLALIVRQKSTNNASQTSLKGGRMESLNGYIGETTLTVDTTQGKPRITDLSIKDVQ